MTPTDGIPERLIVAIGGNAIDSEGTGEALFPLAALGQQLVITHGNGPVVGRMTMRTEMVRERAEPMPLDIYVAHSQGGVAYLLMQALQNALRTKGNSRRVVCLLTQVDVDPHDQAFLNPSKAIGDFYTEDEARVLGDEMGWLMREDSGRGWRHVVPSPTPKHIVDVPLIRTMAESGAVVIAGGGGGVPVVRDARGRRRGIEAVIDKDRTTALMANMLGIDDMMILTAVPRVAVNFGKPNQTLLDRVSLSEIKQLHAEGHFPPGSMGPKIDAAVQFLEGGGRRALIGRIEDAVAILNGEAGTQIIADAALAWAS